MSKFKPFNNRHTSWTASGLGSALRCPVEGCIHVGQIITKAHCRIEHGMTQEEVKKKYGMPVIVPINTKKRFENMKEGFN